MNPNPISVRTLAKIAGVSPTTVSLALRESPCLPKETISRIRKLAKEHGYQRNPKLTSILTATVNTRYQHTGEVIAYIITRENRREWRPDAAFQAMRERAKEHGYDFEAFFFLDDGLSGKRANQILQTRGITGIVVCPLPYALRKEGKLTIPLDWSKYSVVELDDTITEPVLHKVRHDHLAGIWLALQELEKLGYRRIGLCVSEEIELATHHRWSAGYFYWVNIRKLQIAPLICKEYNPNEIKRWIKKNRLEVVLSPGVELLDMLIAAGFKVPEDIAFASLDLHDPGSMQVAGIDQERAIFASMAIDLLVTMLNRRASGELHTPTCLTASCTWLHGSTCVVQKNSKRLSPATDICV